MKQIALGKIYREHGLKGEVKVLLYNPDSENFKKGNIYTLKLKDTEKKVSLVAIKQMPPHVLLKFAEINSMNESEVWRQAEVLMDASLLKPLLPGEYYLSDLFGKKVFDEHGIERGVLKALEGDGKNMFLSIENRGKIFLVPLVDEWISDVKEDSVKILIPEGLE